MKWENWILYGIGVYLLYSYFQQNSVPPESRPFPTGPQPPIHWYNYCIDGVGNVTPEPPEGCPTGTLGQGSSVPLPSYIPSFILNVQPYTSTNGYILH